MKKLHYLMVVNSNLTGDSEIIFFDTRKELEKAFNKKTKKLLKLCIDNNFIEDEDYEFGSNKFMVSFKASNEPKLAKLLNDCNTMFKAVSVDVNDDVTHYIAYLDEWVEESSIKFYDKINCHLTSVVNINNEIRENNLDIDINDKKTWFDEDGETEIFKIFDYGDYTDVFFGHSLERYYTIRTGEINTKI